MLGPEFPQQSSHGDTPNAKGGAGAFSRDHRDFETTRIREYDRKLEAVANELYPQTDLLRQVQGVGTLSALAFVLTLEDASRFEKSRAVGAYQLGLAPGKDQSGERDRQKHISKHGDEMLRRHLVGCANYVMGPFAQDSDLSTSKRILNLHGFQ